MVLQKTTVALLLLASGALGGPAASSGPVSNNPRVDIKVKFKSTIGGDADNFLGDNYYVKKVTKDAVLDLLDVKNIDEDLYPSDKVKVKWDHYSIEDGYYQAYISFQFKYGEEEAAEAFYNAVAPFDMDGTDGSDATSRTKTYIKGKLNPGYDYDADTATCEDGAFDGTFLAQGDLACAGYASCLRRDASGDATGCTDYEYDGDGHYCHTVELLRPECEVQGTNSVSLNDDPDACRDNIDGAFFKSDVPMKCTGYLSPTGEPTDYTDAYVCNNMDITKCWGKDDSTGCSYCEKYVYYKSSNPLTNCTFTEEDTHGYCITGFCRNQNCYVKGLVVTLTNGPEDSVMVTGHYISIVYAAMAVLTIGATMVFPPTIGGSVPE